ncbi:MAG: class I SAM-dependent methyltransferase [bacterium]|nr:class I SAM-dependent methyltransferase [bacterium]
MTLRRRLAPLVPRAIRRGLRDWLGDDRPPAELFGAVYRDGVWGGDDSDFHSGLGSHSSELLEPYVAAVRAFLAERPTPPIVVDVGCGDFAATRRLADVAARVVACDVVPALVERNRRRFARPNVEFVVLDAVADPLPPGDVVIVKQVLQHLGNADIAAIVTKLAQFPIWIVCEHLPDGSFVANVDKPTGADTRLDRRSGVVLTEPPFDVRPQRALLLCEVPSEGGVIRTTAYETR